MLQVDLKVRLSASEATQHKWFKHHQHVTIEELAIQLGPEQTLDSKMIPLPPRNFKAMSLHKPSGTPPNVPHGSVDSKDKENHQVTVPPPAPPSIIS